MNATWRKQRPGALTRNYLSFVYWLPGRVLFEVWLIADACYARFNCAGVRCRVLCTVTGLCSLQCCRHYLSLTSFILGFSLTLYLVTTVLLSSHCCWHFSKRIDVYSSAGRLTAQSVVILIIHTFLYRRKVVISESVYSPAFTGTKLYCLVTVAHRCK